MISIRFGLKGWVPVILSCLLHIVAAGSNVAFHWHVFSTLNCFQISATKLKRVQLDSLVIHASLELEVLVIHASLELDALFIHVSLELRVMERQRFWSSPVAWSRGPSPFWFYPVISVASSHRSWTDHEHFSHIIQEIVFTSILVSCTTSLAWCFLFEYIL